MQTRPFLPALLSVLSLGAYKDLPETVETGATNTTFHPVTPYRSRGQSRKFGAFYRSKRGRTVRSHHNPKFRKKLRYQHVRSHASKRRPTTKRANAAA